MPGAAPGASATTPPGRSPSKRGERVSPRASRAGPPWVPTAHVVRPKAAGGVPARSSRRLVAWMAPTTAGLDELEAMQEQPSVAARATHAHLHAHVVHKEGPGISAVRGQQALPPVVSAHVGNATDKAMAIVRELAEGPRHHADDVAIGPKLVLDGPTLARRRAKEVAIDRGRLAVVLRLERPSATVDSSAARPTVSLVARRVDVDGLRLDKPVPV